MTDTLQGCSKTTSDEGALLAEGRAPEGTAGPADGGDKGAPRGGEKPPRWRAIVVTDQLPNGSKTTVHIRAMVAVADGSVEFHQVLSLIADYPGAFGQPGDDRAAAERLRNKIKLEA